VQTTGLPPTHTPDWQVSVWVQALPSLQAVPSALDGLEHVPVAGSQVPATWHWSEAVQMTPVQRPLATQAPPEQIWPAGHCELPVQAPQTPEAQTWPVGHCELVAQAPHRPPLQTWPVGHCELAVHPPQTPAVQLWPAAQALPQAPQFLVSVLVFTQTPPQATWPLGQVQTPAVQLWPAAQALPQPPQFDGSLPVFTQTPLQSVCPAGQPLRQVCVVTSQDPAGQSVSVVQLRTQAFAWQT
jgi:hypothetical protein